MAGWSLWDNLPDPTGEELHVHPPSEGSDWKLLLLPLAWVPQGRWRIWWHQNLEPPSNPSPFSSPGRGFHRSCWRLV